MLLLSSRPISSPTNTTAITSANSARRSTDQLASANIGTPRSGLTAWLVSLLGWRADLAAFALGLLSAAALPPVFALPVLLVAIPGLLLLIDGSRGPAV